ncbi:hypothetical protein [Candidatus Galacturonibacter soehngenii]|uniref:Uncharacterized protein n=1 Tax=Candidatus Galacturonatibacter soehngenii TaxID=2307010 RepID=A0A7V7QNU7_9FIRM|nr:hypothetical protein [Candidatus Galacturonibacter soehngenii]KAB1440500.1 hypothetical protein F7O84_01310 [Candidatus Galacturonibacter soehngenii]
MKKKMLFVVLVLMLLTGCSQADVVSNNLSKQADNFNVLRRITVINGISDDIMYQMTGKFSLVTDSEDRKIDLIIENEDGSYSKNFIGYSDNTNYIIEDLDTNYVDKYKFTINYNPKMWVPVEIDTID